MAAAAAIWGETRWVRPPRPWRPSKLRLEVEAQRSPGCEDVRVHAQAHRAAGRRASRSRRRGRPRRGPPSRPGAATCCEPGTTIASTVDATRRPLTTSAAARRSPIREFVHEPMNTRSSWISCDRRAGLERPCTSARARRRRRRGSGTASVTGTTMPGFVPQVTSGDSALASTSISVSKRRALVGLQLAPGAASTSARRAPGGRRPTRRSSRRARPCRRGRRPRSSCCRSSCGPPSRAPRSPGRRTRRRGRRRRRCPSGRSCRGSGPSA